MVTGGLGNILTKDSVGSGFRVTVGAVRDKVLYLTPGPQSRVGCTVQILGFKVSRFRAQP